MLVRCPYCHSPIEVDSGDYTLTATKCPTCQLTIDLLGDETLVPETKRIGHFELVQPLGSGAYGSVWRARDTELDRTVAVKIPRGSLVDDQGKEMFLREARAAAQLNHPNIVSVHEVGRADDTLYIITDYVAGIDLADWLAMYHLTAHDAADLCARICDGLQEAHNCGIVHRDLKPSNIMMDFSDEPHITDFGLAKRDAETMTMTRSGQPIGTPAYMSPESAAGKGHQADHRCDVYGVGVMLFEMLTGELPFRGTMSMVMHQVINDEPPNPRELNASVPRDLATICLKCMEKDPHQRYDSAKELADDLRRFVAGQAIRAQPPKALGRMWRWYWSNPSNKVICAGALMTFGGAVLVMWSLVGFVVMALGQIDVRDMRLAIAEMVVINLLLYIPMVWIGIETLHGKRFAICAGIAICAAATVLVVLYMGSWLDLQVLPRAERHERFQLLTLLLIPAFFGLLAYLNAALSAFRTRSDRHPKAPRRESGSVGKHYTLKVKPR